MKDMTAHMQLGVIGAPCLYGAQAKTSYDKCRRAPRPQQGGEGLQYFTPTRTALERVMKLLEDSEAQ